MGKTVFSGIKPSGSLHLGNYIGAISQWVKGQDDGLNLFCVVDLHAITVEQDPKDLKNNTLDLFALMLASGIDPEKSILFIQSQNPDHANLGWIANCYLSMGQMNRMTQYKEKSDGKESVSVGLFDYPALMAADILLYDTTEVPVGEDQKQHVELARDLAQRFNSKYGDTFVIPNPIIPKIGGRVMSLTNPLKKMSKSESDPKGTINLLDNPSDAKAKIASAVTDSDNKIVYSDSKPGVSNLLEIYSNLTNLPIASLEKKFENTSYKDFKIELGDVVEKFLIDIQEKYDNYRSADVLKEVTRKGLEKSYEISHKKLNEVYEKIGFAK